MKHIILSGLAFILQIGFSQAQIQSNKTVNINGKTLNLQKISLMSYRAILSKVNRHIKDTLIAKHNGLLKIKLVNGKEVAFKDIKGEANAKTFSFKGILSNRFYIILGKYYDNGEYLLVDRFNGTTTSLWGEPFISPDGSYIVTYSGALGYDMMPNGLQMFKVIDNTLKLDWEYKIEDWEPEAIRWNDNHSFIVSKYIPADLSKTNHEVKEYIKISFSSN